MRGDGGVARGVVEHDAGVKDDGGVVDAAVSARVGTPETTGSEMMAASSCGASMTGNLTARLRAIRTFPLELVLYLVDEALDEGGAVDDGGGGHKDGEGEVGLG